MLDMIDAYSYPENRPDLHSREIASAVRYAVATSDCW